MATTQQPPRTPYNLAHLAVKRQYGPPSQHPCTGCGEQAYDWSLKSNPAGPVITDSSGTFSTNVEDYEPRCRPCHAKADDYTAAARNKLASLRTPEYNAEIGRKTSEGIRRSRERRVAAGGSPSWGGGLR